MGHSSCLPVIVDQYLRQSAPLAGIGIDTARGPYPFNLVSGVQDVEEAGGFVLPFAVRIAEHEVESGNVHLVAE